MNEVAETVLVCLFVLVLFVICAIRIMYDHKKINFEYDSEKTLPRLAKGCSLIPFIINITILIITFLSAILSNIYDYALI